MGLDEAKNGGGGGGGRRGGGTPQSPVILGSDGLSSKESGSSPEREGISSKRAAGSSFHCQMCQFQRQPCDMQDPCSRCVQSGFGCVYLSRPVPAAELLAARGGFGRRAGMGLREAPSKSGSMSSVARGFGSPFSSSGLAGSFSSSFVTHNAPPPQHKWRSFTNTYLTSQPPEGCHSLLLSSSELLVPIEIDFELEGRRVVDFLTWDLKDASGYSPEDFAATYCLEMDLPAQFEKTISMLIYDQLEDAGRLYQYVPPQIHPTESPSPSSSSPSTHLSLERPLLDSLSVAPASPEIVFTNRKPVVEDDRAREEKDETDKGDQTEKDEKAEEERREGECIRSLIIDVQVGYHQFKDRFDWDIHQHDNEVGPFVRSLVAEIGLPKVFEVAIAHAMRKQIFEHQKNWVLAGTTFFTSLPQRPDLVRTPVELARYTPSLGTTSLPGHDLKDDRESRYQRRQATAVSADARLWNFEPEESFPQHYEPAATEEVPPLVPKNFYRKAPTNKAFPGSSVARHIIEVLSHPPKSTLKQLPTIHDGPELLSFPVIKKPRTS